LYGYNNDGIVQIKTAATYKTQMWFRPSGNAGGYNSAYWSRIEHDMGTLNIIGSSYGQLSIASSNGSGNGARIYFSGSTGAVNNALSLEGPVNSGRIALITYASSPITINGGNLLVGTTTDTGYKLDVNGTSIYRESLTNTIGGFLHKSTSTSNDAFWSIVSGSVYFIVSAGGYCKTTSNLVTEATGVGTINASAISQIDSVTKGFLPPRMTNAQMLAIATPAEGLMVYDTTNRKLCCYDGATWQNLF
jgi:hypothetical protein